MSKLREIRDGKGISQQKLADLVNVTRHTIIRLENGTTPIDEAWAKRLAPHLDCEPYELYVSEEDQRIIMAGDQTIPVEGRVAAGVWLETDAVDESAHPPIQYIAHPSYKKDIQFALLVTGDSMDKTILDGEYAVCVRFADIGISEPEDGKLVVVERHRAGAVESTIKRFRVVDGRPELWPESNNPKFQEPISPDHTDDDTEVFVIALVIGAFRPF